MSAGDGSRRFRGAAVVLDAALPVDFDWDEALAGGAASQVTLTVADPLISTEWLPHTLPPYSAFHEYLLLYAGPVAGIVMVAVPPSALTAVALFPTALPSKKIVMSAGTLLAFLTVTVQLPSAAQTPVPSNVVMATTPPDVAAAKDGRFRSVLSTVLSSVGAHLANTSHPTNIGFMLLGNGHDKTDIR
jgi:hypothetical protein